MANAFAGYIAPGVPTLKFATDRRTRGADEVDLQQMVIYDRTSDTGAAVDASGLHVNVRALVALPAGTNSIGGVTIPDGAAASIGALADAEVAGAGAASVIAILKRLRTLLGSAQTSNPQTFQGKTFGGAQVNVPATIGDHTIVAAVGGQRIKLVSYVLVSAAAVGVRWYSGAGGTPLSGRMPLAANSGAAPVGQPSSHLFETAVGAALVLNTDGSAAIGGHISYFTEA